MTWKDITMPDRVRSLPRTPEGYPVPFVAEWEADLRMRPDPSIGTNRISCSCSVGVGVPMLGNVCPERTWRCIVDKLCGVCGGPLDSGVFPSSVFVGHTELRRFTESALHPECAEYTLSVCPGLPRHGSLRVGVWECSRYEVLVEVCVSAPSKAPIRPIAVMSIDSPMLSDVRLPMVVGRPLAQPSDGLLLPRGDWMSLRRAS